MKQISLYFHIPFCIKKCNYCSFYSVKFKNEIKDIFIKNLIKEINLNKDLLSDYEINTIYFGGGTPSLLDEKDFEMIFNSINKNLKIKKNIEITIEANPESVIYEKFRNLINYGINRVSLGVQTFIDYSLKLLGRIYKRDDIFKSFEIIRKCGFKNVNIDLLLGIPNENLKDLENSLKESLLLNPEHISIYSLEYHKSSKIYFDLIKGKVKSWSRDIEKDGYILIKDFLSNSGYKQYEISNFSKEGFESIHNLNYWNGGEYLGFGPKSFSFINGIYIKNGDLFFYIRSLKRNKKPNIKIYYMSKEKLKRILFILSLRKIDGLNIKDFEKKHGNINKLYNELNNLEKDGFISISQNNIKLTTKGILISNEIFSNLI